MVADKLIDQIVIHRSLGRGIVLSVDEKYLEVDFTEKSKVSKFAYPACFNGFLVLENSDLQEEIETDVDVWKRESGALKKEELRHQYEKTIHDIEARRIAAEEKKLRAAHRAMEHRSAYSNVKTEKTN